MTPLKKLQSYLEDRMEREAKSVEEVKEKGDLVQGIVLGKSVAYLNILTIVDCMVRKEENS